MALGATLIIPFNILANFTQVRIMRVADEKSDSMLGESKRLMGDAIANFRTVQSFGHEELIVQKFAELT